MRYLSTFSGIEAATVAWHPLGWEPVGFSEIEPFPSAVLKHHYPQVQNYGDITQFGSWSVEPFRLLVGGSPCQSFSVAGLRKGLADERGNLMLTFGKLAEHYRPTWVVWENVPGVLSSNGGRDFGTFLGMLAEFGYGFAYRVLDAQYFGVAQRRRRVFVVAHLGDWRPAAAVLFDPHSLSGHPPPSREKGERTASFAAGGIGSYGEGVGTLRANGGDLGGGSETLISTWWDGEQTAATLTKKNAGGDQRMPDKDNFGGVLVPHTFKLRGGCEGGGKGYLGQDECAFTLSTHQDQHLAQPMAFDVYNQKVTGDHVGIVREQHGTNMNAVLMNYAVRRLTPIECERLQGFPDNYTAIPWRGKEASQCPDGPRYKALGNSMAVPVMRWIGERIQAVDDMLKELNR